VAVTAALAFVVAWWIPSGQVAERPGPTLDLAARIAVTDDTPVTPIDGRYDALTVRFDELSMAELAFDRLAGGPDQVVPSSALRPADVDPAVFHDVQHDAFVDGGAVAAAVAERALGESVHVRHDGLRVLGVLPGGAADGTLRVDDVNAAVDGTPVTSQSVLTKAIAAAAGARPLRLEVRRDTGSTPDTVELSIRPAVPAGGDRPALGIVVSPAEPQVDLAVPVAIDGAGVEGPSAGLMTALTVYDELSPVDVAGGRVIAGTGTLAADGTVGDIGGIRAKAVAAAEVGADLLLTPADQAADARDAVGGRLTVVGVTTFADALAALGHPLDQLDQSAG